MAEHKPPPTDINSIALVNKMNDILTRLDGKAKVYVKWTCPGCGERVTSTQPNSFHTDGYTHEECGVTYTGDMFGMALVTIIGDEPLWSTDSNN